jgi:hypothetical protein
MTNPTAKLLIVSACVALLLGLSGTSFPVQAQFGDDDPFTATAEFLGGVFAAATGNQGDQKAPPPPDPDSSPSPGALTTSPSKPPTAHQLHNQGVLTVDDFFGLFEFKPDPGSQSPPAAGPPASSPASPPAAGAQSPTVIPPPPGAPPPPPGSAPLTLNNVTGYGYDPAGGRVIVTRGGGWPQEYLIPPGGVQINWGSGIEGPPDHLPGSHQQSGGMGGSTSGSSPPGLAGSGQGQQANTGATTAPGG